MAGMTTGRIIPRTPLPNMRQPPTRLGGPTGGVPAGGGGVPSTRGLPSSGFGPQTFGPGGAVPQTMPELTREANDAGDLMDARQRTMPPPQPPPSYTGLTGRTPPTANVNGADNAANEARQRQREMELQARLDREAAERDQVFQAGESERDRAERIAAAEAERTGARQDLAERARLNDETFSKRLALLSGGGGGDGYAGTGGPDPREGAQGVDPTGARAAAFARVKDQAGLRARSSLNSFRAIMGDRGLLGSGAEGAGTADIINGADSEMGDFDRDQMIMDVERSGQIEDRNASHALTRRGQDLSHRQSLMGLMGATLY